MIKSTWEVMLLEFLLYKILSIVTLLLKGKDQAST